MIQFDKHIFLKWVAKNHQLGRLMNLSSSRKSPHPSRYLHQVSGDWYDAYQFAAFLMLRLCCMEYLGLTIIIPLRKWVFNHTSGFSKRRFLGRSRGPSRLTVSQLLSTKWAVISWPWWFARSRGWTTTQLYLYIYIHIYIYLGSKLL